MIGSAVVAAEGIKSSVGSDAVHHTSADAVELVVIYILEMHADHQKHFIGVLSGDFFAGLVIIKSFSEIDKVRNKVKEGFECPARWCAVCVKELPQVLKFLRDGELAKESLVFYLLSSFGQAFHDRLNVNKSWKRKDLVLMWVHD